MPVVLFLLIFLPVALATPGAKEKGAKEKEVKTETYSYNVASGSRIIIENERGDISVEGWDKNTCEVNVFKSSTQPTNFDKIKISADAQPNRLKLRTSVTEKLAGENTVDYIISVPSNVDLQLKTSVGKVQVRDFTGRVSFHTERGDVKLTNVNGVIEGKSEAGNISADLPAAVTQAITLKAGEGSVKANLDNKTNAFIWAEVEDGVVKSNLPLQPVQANEANLLKGQMGRGGKLVYMQVGRGSIDLVTPGGTGIAAQPKTSDDRAAASPEPARRQPSTGGVSPSRSGARDVPSNAPGRSDRRPYNPRTEASSNRDADRSAAETGQSGRVFNVETNLITLNATVRDRRTSRTVSNLRKQDFSISENHVQQELTHFSPVDTPFNLLLLLDISGSIREQFHIVQEASIRFTEMLRPKDRIAVAVFNSRFKLLSDFTNDRHQLSRAIYEASPGGGTAFYDAMYRSVNSIFRGISGRKAIVVFTDGVDNQNQPGQRQHGSRITFPELFSAIEESDITIYSIFLDTEADNPSVNMGGGGGTAQIIIDILGGGGWPGSSGPRRGRVSRPSESELYANARKELNEMAEQTGGQMYSPRQAADLNGVYRQIVDELSVQYSLGYYSSNPTEDGQFRRISVRIPNKPDYVVRTRRGYYATGRSRQQDVLNKERSRFDRHTY
jgi:VWFA-related protein